MNDVSHPPVLIVDGSAWDLSNLTSERLDNNFGSGPECDTLSRRSLDASSRRSFSEDSLGFAAYPTIEEVPEALDVDDIFQKLKANNLVKMGKVANSHLPSRSSEHEEARKKEAEQRPRRVGASSSSIGLRESAHSSTSTHNSSSRGRERASRRARTQDRNMFNRTQPRSSRPSLAERGISQSDILRQAMDQESRPGDDLVSGGPRDFDERSYGESSQSSYETGRQQAYQRQPNYRVVQDIQEEEEDEEDEERMLVEVTPGKYVPLRGSAEIWDSVLNGNTVECFCFGCSLQLVTVNDADMVMCVACHTISPVDGSQGGGGLGLGMKEDDAKYERRRFEESRRSGGFNTYR